MNWLDLLQWPAMVVTVAASYLVSSSHKARRNTGFWLFLVSNAMWIAWGWPAHAYALIVLQVCLAAMNIRGAMKTDPEAAEPAATGRGTAGDLPPDVSAG